MNSSTFDFSHTAFIEFEILYGTESTGRVTSMVVTKRCRSSWLTKTALVYEPNAEEGGLN
jgi:hypothetical protein